MSIPLLAMVNISIGFLVPGYSVVSQHISELALETAFVAWTHRITDILIGISMCLFAISCYGMASAKFTFATMFSFGLTWIFAGIFILGSPLHDIYGLTTILLVVPVIFALEMKGYYPTNFFEKFSVCVTLIHVTFFWFFSYGYMPDEFKGISQRVWVFITLVWYGVAAFQLLKVARKQAQQTPLKSTG